LEWWGHGSFLPLFRLHPDVDKVFVTDHQPSRMDRPASHYKLDATFPTFEGMLQSDCGSVATFTPRWPRPVGPGSLEAGKNVCSN
jgi:hypothetical protein